jgi:hypothetical protein
MGPLPLQDKGVRVGPVALPLLPACPLPAYQWGVFIHTGDFLKSVFKGQRPLSDKSYKPQPQTSVGDPDVFGPAGTGSGSISQRYGSGDPDPGIRIRGSGSAPKCHGSPTLPSD